jgi:PAS domain S-box-containing protein
MKLSAEAAQRETENRFHLALRNTSITVFEQDLDLRYTWIYNAKVGFDAQSVLGKTDAELVDAATTLLLTSIKREVLETGQPACREVSVVVPAQAASYFELTVEPRHGPDGKINGIICSSVDISERRQEQDALKLTKQRLDEVIDGAGLGTWEWNLETGHLQINARWAEMLGYTIDELAPLSIETWAGLRHPDDLLEANKRAERHIAGDTPYFEVEARMRHKDGSWVWVRDRGRVATRGGDGLPILMIGSFLDITSTKAKATSIAKGEFLAKMSHEIRTPMNGVIGMLEVMGRTDLSPEAREHVKIALSSAQDLMHILSEIIDVSQLEAHQVSINPEVFEIGALINSSIALFGSRAKQKDILLTASISPNVPTWVAGDRRRIRQVLNNLIGNAVKFTDRGAISVATSYEAGRGILRITVSDTGIGMPEDVSAKAFDLFYQADEAATRRVGGSGLGLAICRQLVELMGGEISVSSKPGCGSEFSVTLCLASVAEPERSVALPATEIATRPLQVLVVEDNDANQKILLAILSSVGHAVTIAENGADAVGLAASQSFDLILMDIMLPVMDGVTATRQIRELGGRAGGIPIIALTANALGGDRNLYLAAGMTDYLAKPIDVRALLEAVARASPEAEQLD